MQINISSKHIDLTPAIEEFINSKAEKLTRFFDRIEQIDVKIEKTTHGFTTEIISDIEHHNPIVSNNEDLDLYASIDGSIDKSVRQLTDLKTRLRDQKHNTPTGGQDR
jgi:putative sigma-54 modulation protein